MISKQLVRALMYAAGAILCVCAGAAFADGSSAAVSGGIGTVAKNVTDNLGNVAKLLTAGAYVAGFGFAIGSIVKFKAHKDNPTQIPISQPIVLLFVGAGLIFSPNVFTSSGTTLFGAKATYSSGSGKISGVESF